MQLRNNATDSENKLWQKLKNNQTGFKFIRQYSIENFVVDFYCPKARLAIELIGGIHKKADIKKHDVFRKAYIEAFGITVLEISNGEVENDLGGTVEKIKGLL